MVAVIKGGVHAGTSPYLRLALAQVVLSVGLAACASVETVRFTGEHYPAKSPGDVQALSDTPSRPYRAMAELRVSEVDSAHALSQEILKKAARLGADAVIFSKPETHTERRLLYEPVAGGQVNAEIPYDITVTHCAESPSSTWILQGLRKADRAFHLRSGLEER